MSPTNDGQNSPAAYLFRVDVLIEDTTNARALEKLLHVLNASDFSEFRIISGVELGAKLEQIEKNGFRIEQQPNFVPELTKPKTSKSTPSNFFTEMMESLVSSNRLIRMKVNKGRGKRLEIPCRVLKHDEKTQTTTVYHVDEKVVYKFKWNEIEDIVM